MFDFTPPTEESIEERREKLRMETEASSMAINLITNMILSTSSAPESRKIELRIMLAVKDFRDKLARFLDEYGNPLADVVACDAAYPLRKEVLEYIQLASAGLDSFIATHPASEREPK